MRSLNANVCHYFLLHNWNLITYVHTLGPTGTYLARNVIFVYFCFFHYIWFIQINSMHYYATPNVLFICIFVISRRKFFWKLFVGQ